MSGTGKGVLRIAIEDFIETFDLGKSLHRWYVTVIEKFEDEALEMYEEFLNHFEYAEFMPAMFKPGAIGATMKRRPVQIIPILISVGMMVIGMVIGVFDPIRRLASYKVDRVAKSARPSPFEAWTMARRLDPTHANPNELLKDLGLSDILIKGYEELSKQLLPANEYIVAWRRGLMSNEEVDTQLLRMGMTPHDVLTAKRLSEALPGISDLIRMSVREAFSPEVVERFKYAEAFPNDVLEHTRKQGLSDEWVKRYWFAHWDLPSPNQGYEMLHRLRPGRSELTFTESDLDLLLRTADYAPYFRDRLKAISYNPITRVDIRRMYRLGVFNADEVKERYKDLGYTEKDAQALTEFTVKYENGSGGSTQDEIDNLTASLAGRLYKKNIITRDDYRARLMRIKYTPEIADLLINLADQEIKEGLTIDFRKDFIGDMLNDIQKAYTGRLIDEPTARAALSALGIDPQNIDYIIKKETYQISLDELNNELKLLVESYQTGATTRDGFIARLGQLGISGTHQASVISQVELSLKYRSRRLTEAQYRAAVMKKVINVDDYYDALIGLGYPDKDIDILVALYFPTGV